jgi:hypothetical protein
MDSNHRMSGSKPDALDQLGYTPTNTTYLQYRKNFGRIGRNRTLRTPSPTGAENTRGMLLRAELRFPARNTLPLSYVPMLSIYSTEKSLVGRAYLVEYAFFSRAVK